MFVLEVPQFGLSDLKFGLQGLSCNCLLTDEVTHLGLDLLLPLRNVSLKLFLGLLELLLGECVRPLLDF